MRRSLSVLALAIAFESAAFAADLPLPGGPATYVPTSDAPFDWGGIYLGANGGFAFGNSNWTSNGFSTGNFPADGFLIGGTIGANFRGGPWILGLEVDADYNSISGSTSNAGCTAIGPGPTCQTSGPVFGSGRLRAGYTFLDRFLLYGTVGVAAGDNRASSGGAVSSTLDFGWTGGAGLEVAVMGNWTAKLEYLYVTFPQGLPCPANCFIPSGSVSLNENLVRVGINYKLDGLRWP
jgi:outer membrane immunogenic protein